MFQILGFAKKQWYVMVFLLILLFVQAFCELTLPGYTSDIVDVGIQNQGVEYPVPEEMRKETFEQLWAFMDEAGRQRMESAYHLEGDRYLASIGSMEEEERKKLQEYMLPAEMVVLFLNSDDEEAVRMREQMLSELSGKMPDAFSEGDSAAAATAFAQSMRKQLEAYPEYMAEAMGIQFVVAEYRAMGMDQDKLQMGYLKSMGVRMLGIAIISMIASILVSFMSSRLAAFTAKDLRQRVFSKVMGFSNAEMNQFSTASLITRCTNDVQQIQMFVTVLFRMVAFAPIMGIGAIVKVLKTTTSMAWIIVLAVLAVLMVIIVLMLVAMPKFKQMQKLVDGLNLVSREILTGLPVIRAFGREQVEEKRFEAASGDLMRTQLFTSRAMAMMMPTMMFIMNGVSVLIMWVGADKIDAGNLQVGEMMAFLIYAMHIVISFLMISMVSIILPRATVAAERIREVLDSETLILDSAEPVSFTGEGRGEIEFSHVSFRYPNAEEDALSDISFTAKPGQTTAIIGSTGCGKSTLVHLIPRLFDVTEGSVRIDGVDVRNVRIRELRERIGFVPQKGILFSGTIASNIRFGNQEASDELVQKSAAIAQAQEFIEEKEDGFRSAIAQGGNNVSGGQKQRLAIARAIAKQADIYVFDDSFSALDYRTDAALRRALKEQVSDAAVIIVAQRISTILHADQILVLEDGRIVGKGTHEELMAENEVYQQIAASQLSRDELEGKGA